MRDRIAGHLCLSPLARATLATTGTRSILSFSNSDADVRRLVLTSPIGNTEDQEFGEKRIQAAAFIHRCDSAVTSLGFGRWRRVCLDQDYPLIGLC